MARMAETKLNFIRQQGFDGASADSCGLQYPALMFQPRLIGVLVVAGVVAQAPAVFLTLAAALWCSALMPTLNPFEWLYNHLVAARRGRPMLTAAPAPRRFAQGMAATLTSLIGLALLAGWHTLAWVFEAILLLALGALIFGGFCFGSYVFHLLAGNRTFANRTLPWS
jgi:hypothetical protein